MRRIAVLGASARLVASLLALLLFAAPALAGDRANIDFIGYSADGGYFAFEEYGVHDGSGGAYSSVQIIDLANDKWMYGSPFTVDAGGDGDSMPPLAEVRAAALAKAQDRLDELSIGAPASIAWLLGDGVPDADGKLASFAYPSCCGPGQTDERPQTLRLEPFAAKAAADCAPQEVMGYALTYEFEGSSVEAHRDGPTVPKSRGCPLDYRLYAVLSPFDAGAGSWVAIVSYYPMGFEGPDRRFLAVPIGVP